MPPPGAEPGAPSTASWPQAARASARGSSGRSPARRAPSSAVAEREHVGACRAAVGKPSRDRVERDQVDLGRDAAREARQTLGVRRGVVDPGEQHVLEGDALAALRGERAAGVEQRARSGTCG